MPESLLVDKVGDESKDYMFEPGEHSVETWLLCVDITKTDFCVEFLF